MLAFGRVTFGARPGVVVASEGRVVGCEAVVWWIEETPNDSRLAGFVLGDRHDFTAKIGTRTRKASAASVSPTDDFLRLLLRRLMSGIRSTKTEARHRAPEVWITSRIPTVAFRPERRVLDTRSAPDLVAHPVNFGAAR
jgi:hypothetical protein